MNNRTEGWGNLDNAKKAYYFVNGRSLCRNWLAWGSPRWETNQASGESCDKGTCKSCWTKRVAQERKP